jgi:copper chaperone NosL
MMKRQWIWLLALLLAACAQGQAALAPPVIRYGEDLCAECNMIISDARFASSYLYALGNDRYQPVLFDDIGNMLNYAHKHPEQEVVAWYVHDYTSEAWLDATQAHYVISPAIHTPMGHGIAAHNSLAAAEQMAAEVQGNVLTWAALQELPTGHGSHAGHE